MVKFQSERHINVLDVEKGDFNEIERKTASRVKLAIILFALYHLLKVIIASVMFAQCETSRGFDCKG